MTKCKCGNDDAWFLISADEMVCRDCALEYEDRKKYYTIVFFPDEYQVFEHDACPTIRDMESDCQILGNVGVDFVIASSPEEALQIANECPF